MNDCRNFSLQTTSPAKAAEMSLKSHIYKSSAAVQRANRSPPKTRPVRKQQVVAGSCTSTCFNQTACVQQFTSISLTSLTLQPGAGKPESAGASLTAIKVCSSKEQVPDNISGVHVNNTDQRPCAGHFIAYAVWNRRPTEQLLTPLVQHH